MAEGALPSFSRDNACAALRNINYHDTDFYRHLIVAMSAKAFQNSCNCNYSMDRVRLKYRQVEKNLEHFLTFFIEMEDARQREILLQRNRASCVNVKTFSTICATSRARN